MKIEVPQRCLKQLRRYKGFLAVWEILENDDPQNTAGWLLLGGGRQEKKQAEGITSKGPGAGSTLPPWAGTKGQKEGSPSPDGRKGKKGKLGDQPKGKGKKGKRAKERGGTSRSAFTMRACTVCAKDALMSIVPPSRRTREDWASGSEQGKRKGEARQG